MAEKCDFYLANTSLSLESRAPAQTVQAGSASLLSERRRGQATAAVVSPAIAGWMKRAYPDSEQARVSHETIYRSLYVQARGVLKKELQACLRTQRAIRRSKHASLKRQGLGKITNAISIKDRPASVEDRAVPGHWEGDLIGGIHNSYIATLVERQSRYVMLAKIEKKDADTVAAALVKHAQRLPTELYKSLTWDRGTEMANHRQFTLATDIAVYFCDPKSPWQRGFQ